MIRPKIGIYGRTNVGKSTLLNEILGRQASIVSPTAGTTTDPVRRNFEILDFAPVIFIDTAGFDDDSELGTQRVAKTMVTLAEVDLAILVTDGELTEADSEFLSKVTCSYIIVKNGEGIIDKIKAAIPLSTLVEPPFFGNRLASGDIVLLVCPIDSEAPSGRLILPQVQALRAALDINAIAITVQPAEVPNVLSRVTPRLVVIDSQVFAEVSPMIPQGVELTSFSILLSELKGDSQRYKQGLEVLPHLKNGDKIMLLEHCSHQTSCDDIARVKIPKLLEHKLGKRFEIVIEKNLMNVGDLSTIALAVQCGGCMTNRRAVMSNIDIATRHGLPITNYGMLLRALSQC